MSHFTPSPKRIKVNTGNTNSFASAMDDKQFNKLLAKQRVETGAVSESVVCLDLALQGFIVALPIYRSPSFDLVACREELLLRVQVKTITDKHGLYIPTGSRYTYSKKFATGRKLKRQYKGTEFEILAGVDKKTAIVYYVPINLIDFSTDRYFLSAEQKEKFRTIDGALDIS